MQENYSTFWSKKHKAEKQQLAPPVISPLWHINENLLLDIMSFKKYIMVLWFPC